MEFISLSAFFITLRETMEAALIVGILLAYLTKTDNHKYKKDIWIGTLLAILASIIGAVLIQLFVGELEGTAEKLFEGIVMITAAAVLTWMIIWMMKNSANLKHELQSQVDTAISEERRIVLISLSFIAVFREGIETVLFMTGVGIVDSLLAVVISGLAGILLAVVLAVLLFRGSVELNLKSFFYVTSVILILFAAGLFAHGFHEFQELGWFGAYGSAAAPFWNVALWDWSSFLPDGSGIGALLRALFGYKADPTLVELVAYVFYWTVMAISYLGIHFKVKNQATPQPN